MVLVVCYGIKPRESITLRTLKKKEPVDSLNIKVWNNGPDTWSDDDLEFIDFENQEVFQDIRNASLSSIYNKFCLDLVDGYILILDHDSDLSGYVFLENDSVDIYCPYVCQNGQSLFPLLNNTLPSQGLEMRFKVLSTISSGMCISSRLVSEMMKKYGDVFDTSFTFYGVDTSFLIRVKKIRSLVIFMSEGSIEHDLSRLNVTESLSFFRVYERLIDAVILFRRYPSRSSLLGLLTQVKLSYKIVGCNYILKLVKIFILGRHPRSNVRAKDSD
jgi:hypothetical protein